jgi:hypothetical protein
MIGRNRSETQLSREVLDQAEARLWPANRVERWRWIGWCPTRAMRADAQQGPSLMWAIVQGWLTKNLLSVLGYAAAAAAVTVAAVLLGARQAGRNAELRPAVLAIAMALLGGCATAPSDGAPRPPVVEYSKEFLARAADEVARLPAGSAIEQMLGDYQVMRDQARLCRRN